MNRFKKNKNNNSSLLVTVGLAVSAFALFYCGITGLTNSNDEQIFKALDTTLSRDIVHCYSVEGRYPASLEYLEKNYGFIYDHSKYSIDYTYNGANKFPSVSLNRLQ